MNPANCSTSKTFKKGLKSCEHETSSNESLDKKLDPKTISISNSLQTENENENNETIEPVENQFTSNHTDTEGKFKPLKTPSGFNPNPKTRSTLRTTRKAFKPEDDEDSCSGVGGGLTSDDCCSEASTLSNRGSSSFFRVNGLHIACMADPPDYDFQPNLQKAREEIMMRRRSPSVDSTIHQAKMDAVNRRKEYSKALQDTKLRRRLSRDLSQSRNKNSMTSLDKTTSDVESSNGGYSSEHERTITNGNESKISVRNIRKLSAGKSGIPRYAKLAGREASAIRRGQTEPEKTIETTERVSDLESSDAHLSSGVSTPIVKKTDEGSVQSLYAPVLLDDETWNKIEELVKTENTSTQNTRRLTWVYGFIAGILAAVVLNLIGSVIISK